MKERNREYKRLMEKVDEYGFEMEKEDYFFMDSIRDRLEVVHGTYIG